jgi:hypothetical protein
MSKTITAAIERFARAHDRIDDLSGALPEEEVTQAYEERTESLIQLLEWDTCDGIANAIRRLVRAQDRIQGLHESSTYRGGFASAEEFDAADIEREEAILALMVARPAEDYPTGTHRFYERAKNLAMLELKDPEAGSSH